ncbi:uncharacterized protein PgNI_03677 [Pyricularia grisea]|uniref:DNA replication checkpoint mediator MRC1 domain-containing protein n=1 Tax=Pyricularia grisea TaxID=148305 RepID=A0A6P8BC04_PYRGI|nr:uncharacterized protein PgNI_03677 [Pyricularia grisea]TLD13328.1 hypothetical protein PgNI_03677 [Pyricularia grisea]
MASHSLSSPASSPNASKPLTHLLSPKSNLRRLLAGIDESSDEEDGREPGTPTITNTTKEDTPQLSHDDEDESEDDDAILRPRGRLASRMQVDATKQVQLESKPTEGARDRVRRLLGLDPQEETTPINAVDATRTPAAQSVEADNAEDEDEDDIRKLHNRRPKAPRARSRTPTPARDSSPDLFVTPSKELALPFDAGDVSDEDADLPENPNTSKRMKNRLLELQQKRIAREKLEQEKNKKDHGPDDDEAADGISGEESDNITDDDGGRKLTQEAASRPSARKASKKALEEMHRETQRLSRSLQLAHEAKTKKKITKASLFERFNFKPANEASKSTLPVVEEQAAVAPVASSSRAATPVSTHHTDAEMSESPTPPTSPPVADKPDGDGPSESLGTEQAMDTDPKSKAGDDKDLPELTTLVARATEEQAAKMLEKGKGKATTADLDAVNNAAKPKRQFRVTLPSTVSVDLGEDEDDLMIVNTKKSKLDAIFDNAPAQRKQCDGAMQALRVLAQLGGSPGKDQSRRRGKFGSAKQPTMTAAQLQLTLHQRAREQARIERERRFEALRAKGVHIQTEEEREREMQDVEDIMAAARREAEEIMLREKEESKADRKRSGEVDPLAWDDSDEEGDYHEAPEEQDSEVELSGSEVEDADMESGAEDDTEAVAEGLVDDQAESDVDSLAEQEDEDHDLGVAPQKSRRAKKHTTVISDDEEEDELPVQKLPTPNHKPRAVEATPKSKSTAFKSPSTRSIESPLPPQSVLRSATKTFIPGLPVKAGEAAGLGLTQIFAGTMDDSQVDPFASTLISQPRPTFDAMPQTTFPQASIAEQPESSIMDTQPAPQQAEETQNAGVNFDFDTQSQVHGLGSLMRDDVFTQASQFPEATQDGGFQGRTPLKDRFIDLPQSTVDTVAVNDTQSREPSAIPESPVMRRGKLRRKVVAMDEDEEDVAPRRDEGDERVADAEDELIPGTQEAANAFSVLNKAAVRKEKQEAFDRKKSKAKEMFQEQAEESEDEYAGLGGAEGEDSDDDGEDVKDMIDDRTKASEEEKSKIAAIYADRERADDEKQVEKLFRDITSGMLRRKRGADYGDLSDEDDGGEARRRMKRRQFAKMQKALFADERVSKVAENPRTSAFMRTIEDRSDDEDMLDILAPSESQQDDAIPDSQPSTTEGAAPAVTGRLPGPQRRRKDLQKPSNLGEVRESLSDLLEEHNSMSSVVPATEEDSESDDADAEEEEAPRTSGSSGVNSNKENRNPRRRAAEVSVVDRISLKRSGSSVSSDDGGSRSARTAFVAGSSSGSFKVPALLRRATTNSSMAASGNGVSSSTGTAISASTASAAGSMGGDEAAKVKKNASKRSGINYFARENERLAALAERERRREQRKFKGAEDRSKVVGGLFAAGKFE